MLLIGLIEITTGTGHTENDYSSVHHQRTDVIAGGSNDTAEDLGVLYHSMVQNANRSKEKLSEIEDRLENDDVSNDEFERIEEERELLRRDLKILKYNKVLIIEGMILK